MYTLESNEDVNQIRFKLQQTQDYLYEIEKKITKQRARIDELKRQKGGLSDKISRNNDMNAKLDAVLDARTNSDLGAREQVLSKQLEQQMQKLGELVERAENVNKMRPPQNQRVDELIRKTLAKYGRSVDALKRICDGTYMSERRNIIFMVNDDGSDELQVEFVKSDNTVFKTSLKRFIGEFE